MKIVTKKTLTIRTPHAGLILINPFLEQLFERLKLTQNKDFIDDEAKLKAVHILYFIATGKKSTKNHVFSLEKILCGVELDTPIPNEFFLSKIEKNEVNAVLKSVIEYFRNFNNISIDVFRATFIRRKGGIHKTTDGWELSIEQKPFDMLLDMIPWSFNMVKLSWMPQIIISEWVEDIETDSYIIIKNPPSSDHPEQ